METWPLKTQASRACAGQLLPLTVLFRFLYVLVPLVPATRRRRCPATLPDPTRSRPAPPPCSAPAVQGQLFWGGGCMGPCGCPCPAQHRPAAHPRRLAQGRAGACRGGVAVTAAGRAAAASAQGGQRRGGLRGGLHLSGTPPGCGRQAFCHAAPRRGLSPATSPTPLPSTSPTYRSL